MPARTILTSWFFRRGNSRFLPWLPLYNLQVFYLFYLRNDFGLLLNDHRFLGGHARLPLGHQLVQQDVDVSLERRGQRPRYSDHAIDQMFSLILCILFAFGVG